VISRNNGWLTVNPDNMSRKNAFEKKQKEDMHKTSFMSPQWMHTQAKRDEENHKQFKAQSVFRQNIRAENNRVFLSDAKELPKSIFNIGSVRHNVMSLGDAANGFSKTTPLRNISVEPVRMIEWAEKNAK
jgi:hypothetical protein